MGFQGDFAKVFEMQEEYKKNYIDKVILRIDFPSEPLEIEDKIPKDLLVEILKLFPIPEEREVHEKGYKIHIENDKLDVSTSDKIKEWYHYSKDKKKLVCVSKKYVFFVYKEWNDKSFIELKNIFDKIISILFRISNIQVTRLGLRYINNIEFTDSISGPTEWDGYLNPNIISIFKMADTESKISRAFQNLELILPDMMIRFQYGMHNPDYPAPVKRKLFILDYDGYCESLQGEKELKDNLTKINAKLSALFKRSIGTKLEAIMRGDNDGN